MKVALKVILKRGKKRLTIKMFMFFDMSLIFDGRDNFFMRKLLVKVLMSDFLLYKVLVIVIAYHVTKK